jgi:RNA polymerase sigma factor (sigma-70 family)
MPKQTTDPFADFNRLAREVMSYPAMPYDVLQATFVEISTLLDQAVDYLLRVTTFVEDHLCYHLAEIMMSNIKTKKLYRGRWNKCREGVGEGIEIGAENIRVLGQCFDVFKLSRIQRDVAYLPVKRVIRSIRLNNQVYEQIIASFCAATPRYCRIVEDLARLTTRLPDPGHDTVEHFQQVSDLIDQKEMIENMVGAVDPNRLYGVVALVHELHDRLQVIKANIVKAHLRLILKIVRSSTYNDADAIEAFQAGSMGLMHAVSVYDHRGRTSFSTFARQWVRQRVTISRRSSTGPLIRIPFAIWEQYSIIQAEERRLHQQYPEGIPDNMVASRLGLSPEVVRQVVDAVKSSYVTSLDEDLRMADDYMESRVASVPDQQILDQLELDDIREDLFQIVQHLTAEQRKILCLRFGFLEGIENNIDPRERLRELYRQMAGKTIVVAVRQDNEPLPPPDEPLDDATEERC